MSPRDSFWFLAGALVTFAIMVTVRAWLRDRPAQAVRSASVNPRGGHPVTISIDREIG